jgi:hypothetical protein
MTGEKPIRYVLGIKAPGEIDRLLAQHESSTPFMRISVGDILDPKSVQNGSEVNGWLRVVGVVHQIMDTSERILHQTSVYTTDISRDDALAFWSESE